MAPQSKSWKFWHAVALGLILGAIVLVDLNWLKTAELPQGKEAATSGAIEPTKPAGAQGQTGPAADETKKEAEKPKTKAFDTRGIRWIWFAVMLLLSSFVLVAGHGITGLWRGAFIDSRNKISLARFQMTLWTILLVSAYLTAVLININRGQPNPTDIALNPTLWMLMGISTTSLVGSPLIKSGKKQAPGAAVASPPQEERTFELLAKQGVDRDKVDVEGQLVINKSPDDASWGDLFRGEDVGNAAHLDLGKIQMFYFTLIVLFAYGVTLAEMFRTQMTGIESFPDLSSGIVALLGISHTGYLASKAVTRNSA
jgi:hypothetical protein